MWSRICPVGEISVRGNVLVGKYPVGEVSFGKVSGRGIVRIPGRTNSRTFYYLPVIFLFSISPAQWSIKNISKPLFHFIRPFNEITEFCNVKFRKSISSKDGVCRQILEIDSNCTFSKSQSFKIVNFLISFFSQLL